LAIEFRDVHLLSPEDEIEIELAPYRRLADALLDRYPLGGLKRDSTVFAVKRLAAALSSVWGTTLPDTLHAIEQSYLP
jgi:hypothetical protein